MSSDVPQESTTEERRRDPTRVVAFTDGVFAVIITILVFNLKVPLLASGQSLQSVLAAMGPTLVTAFRWLLKGYLMRRPELLWEPASTRSQRLGSGLSAGLIGVYGVGVLVANHSPRLSLAIFAGVPLLYVFTVTLLRKHPSTSTAADGFS